MNHSLMKQSFVPSTEWFANHPTRLSTPTEIIFITCSLIFISLKYYLRRQSIVVGPIASCFCGSNLCEMFYYSLHFIFLSQHLRFSSFWWSWPAAWKTFLKLLVLQGLRTHLSCTFFNINILESEF